MKEFALIILKPDGVTRNLLGIVLDRLATLNLELVALRVCAVTPELAQEHYQHIKGTPFFDSVIQYLTGTFYPQNKVFVFVYEGTDAIKKCRKLAGATNPEEADPKSIRGSFGRITTNNVFENVIHVSSNSVDAEREIRLWLQPEDFWVPVLPEKITLKGKKRVWK